MILLLNNGEDIVYARTPIEESKAWLYLFNVLDARDCYQYLPHIHTGWVEAARKGDRDAAKLLLIYRSDCHYEGEDIMKLKVYTP
jgi:hypothetical protein